MNKTLFLLLLSLIIIFTTFIIFSKPKMHNKIFVYNSDYTIIEKEKPITEKIITKEIKPAITKQKTQKKEEIKQIKKVNKEPTTKKTTIQKKQPKQKEIITTVEKPKEVKKITKKEENKIAESSLTQEEEIIAWNKWHSDIQNKILKDIKLPTLPNGTIFKISFSVDKYGKITNLQTFSTTSQYTPYAIEFIAPVIRSYQGTSILDFPQGSNRITTTFKGGFKISNTSSFSSPNDYNDTEKVIK